MCVVAPQRPRPAYLRQGHGGVPRATQQQSTRGASLALAPPRRGHHTHAGAACMACCKDTPLHTGAVRTRHSRTHSSARRPSGANQQAPPAPQPVTHLHTVPTGDSRLPVQQAAPGLGQIGQLAPVHGWRWVAACAHGGGAAAGGAHRWCGCMRVRALRERYRERDPGCSSCSRLLLELARHQACSRDRRTAHRRLSRCCWFACAVARSRSGVLRCCVLADLEVCAACSPALGVPVQAQLLHAAATASASVALFAWRTCCC